MNEKEIYETLRAMRVAEEKDSRFRDAVWREIRHRRALDSECPDQKDGSVWLEGLRGLFAPTVAVGLATAVLVACAIGSVWEGSTNRGPEVTAKVLDLGIFGPQAEGLAHGRLVVKR